jgi:dihydrofolate reductase
MRKVILSMSVSLDGFIEGPDRQHDWHVVDDELQALEAQTRAFANGVVLLGYQRARASSPG